MAITSGHLAGGASPRDVVASDELGNLAGPPLEHTYFPVGDSSTSGPSLRTLLTHRLTGLISKGPGFGTLATSSSACLGASGSSH